MKKGGAFLLDPVIDDVFCRELFSDEQRQIDETVRDFARKRIEPVREELSVLNQELSRELLREVGEMGLTAIDIPESHGGMELDKTTSALVVEALTTGGSASWVVTFSAHVGIGTLPLVFFGTEEQKQKYLPGLASGESLAAYALTEPGAGSDAQNIKATARLSDDGASYILNGDKIYVTNGGWADLFTVFAKLDGKDVSAFLVERDFEGLKIGGEEKKLGIKGNSTVSLFLEDLKVPKENLLGRPGDGIPIALNVLNIGRFKLGAADLGGCKEVIRLVTEYALERKQFGQPIAFFDAIRRKMADIVVRTYLLDSTIYRTVGLMDQRIATLDGSDPDYNRKAMAALEEYAIEASVSKILGSETMALTADHGVQIYGGNGFSEEYPLAGMYRDTRIDRIFEGTNEINRMVIYGYYLKKALMEELPVREAEHSWSDAGSFDGPLGWELAALDRARRLTSKCLYEAVSIYGQDLRNEQLVGEDLADLIIGYFAASSAINRIRQLGNGAASDPAYRALARLTVTTYLEDVWRLWFRLRPTLFSGAYGQRFLAAADKMLAEIHPPFDPVAEVRLLTDDLYHHGRYRFE